MYHKVIVLKLESTNIITGILLVIMGIAIILLEIILVKNRHTACNDLLYGSLCDFWRSDDFFV